MSLNLKKALVVAAVLVIAAAVLSAIAASNFRDMPSVEIGCQLLARLLGGTILLLAILGGFTVTGTPVQAFAMRIAMVLVGLQLAYPHWTVAVGAAVIVVTLVIVDGFGRRHPTETPGDGK